MAGRVLTALLGPTNTGKTHRAIERMLEHESGMIGLPLRLLAREVYDKVSVRVGEQSVALVTGEEKRVPLRPRYWICTVEAMPMDREVDFVAIDEIQLAAHPERGHVFTDRLLNARGREETFFMGSDTMRPLVQRLAPAAELRTNPRLSRLSCTGARSLAALPPRSAVVAFSMASVYELAERIRRRRGGAAVVLGALSPRTRNAQVALFQAREVDYLVATDAIGMGLNLDLEHVAFAELSKFDGRETRELGPAELAQIAGRAGRYHNDGSFGTVAPVGPLPLAVARAIESHSFAYERSVYWRNGDLDFSSLDALIAALKRAPEKPYLRSIERAEDFSVLAELASRSEIRALARGAELVELLWDVCRIPDYRKLLLDQHAQLLFEIYTELVKRGRLDQDWLGRRISRLADMSGDIDTLLMRLAFVRTWTYVAYQSRWLEDAQAWQARTRAIEDELSDALHERLVERFIERRRSTAHVRTAAELSGPFGRLSELRDALVQSNAPAPTGRWIDELGEAAHTEIEIDDAGRVSFRGRAVGALGRGVDVLHPELVLALDDDVGPGARSRVQRRMLAFTRDLVADLVGASLDEASRGLSAAARGLVYQVLQGLGTVRSKDARPQLAALSDSDRELIARAGIELGERVVYAKRGLTDAAIRRRLALLRAWLGPQAAPELPPKGAPSFRPQSRVEPSAYVALGYPIVGPRAVRADLIERLHIELERSTRESSPPDRDLGSRLACNRAELAQVVRALGYTSQLRPRRPRRRRRARAEGSAGG